MKLCIAEKPAVAREIAGVLGARTKKEGYFEGNGYMITWTFGHLCTLKTPDDYKPEWKRWNIGLLPIMPEKFEIKLIKQKGISKQFNIIKKLVSTCTEVINCGDAGIEGELIQRWVLQMAGCRKPVKRLWISSLTEESIRQGFLSLKESSEYDSLFKAGNSRAVGDWLLGMNASRLYTLKYGSGKGVLSIGRVQTPTLALIVKRFKEIQNFKPEKYWELKTIYRDVVFNATAGKFSKKDNAEELLERIKDSQFSITSFSRKEGKEHPPPLFDLTSLQVECNKKFGFSADLTLKTAQKLYEKKVLSYPRVDTRFLPSDIYPKIPGILKGLGQYSEFTKPLFSDKIRKSKKVFDDKKITDHHAIIPTGQGAGSLSPQEDRIFDTVARRFIAAFWPDSTVSKTNVTGLATDVKFRASGKEIIEKGWRKLYPKNDSEKSRGDSQIIPEFTEGETGPHKPEIQEKETTPPKLYTEATLLQAMETAGKNIDDDELRELMKENGIGRPSTRAGIIETLFRRNYINRSKKNLIPTITGIQLIDTIENELLKSVELTGMWEKKIRQIEKGAYDPEIFLNEMKQMVSTLVSEVRNAEGRKIETGLNNKKSKTPSAAYTKKAPVKKTPAKKTVKNPDELTCPLCGRGKVIKGRTAYGCSRFREGCSFRINFSIQGKKLTPNQITALIEKGKTAVLSGFISDSGKTKGSIILDRNKKTVFVPDEKAEKNTPAPTDTEKYSTLSNITLKCPACGKGHMIRGRQAYGCSRFREGCRFIIPFDELKKKYNRTEPDDEILENFFRDSVIA